MPGRAAVLVPVVAALVAGWAYRILLRPPPPRICGSPSGPSVVSPRIKLHDGRHLAYREWGVPREAARHHVVVVHGFQDSKDFSLDASPELMEQLGVCLISFDRAGYGESDPNPRRTVKSDAMDIQELADHLALGNRFYVVGASMGGYPAWSCIKHIPHRLAGVALVVPVINFWWPSLPPELAREAFGRLQPADRRMLCVAHHAPWLLYGYMTQKLVTPSKIVPGHPDLFSPQDREILLQTPAPDPTRPPADPDKATQQGVHESLYRDLMLGFGRWGFEPMSLADPFPNNDGSVHIWQGAEDRLVPADLQRYVAQQLPWVRYHECADCGHLFVRVRHWSDAILRALLPGEKGEQTEQSTTVVA